METAGADASRYSDPEGRRQWVKDWHDRVYMTTKAAERRLRSRLKKYGMTPDDFRRMLVDQGGVCAICEKPESVKQNTRGPNRTGEPRSLSIDHCHATGVVRGLLCHRCNFGIGYFNDNPSIASAAMAYLLRPATRS